MSYHEIEEEGEEEEYTLADLPLDAYYEISTHFWEWKQFVIFSWICKSTYSFVKNYEAIGKNDMVLIRSTEKKKILGSLWYRFLDWWYKIDNKDTPSYRDNYKYFFKLPPFQSVRAIYWKYNNLESFPIYLRLKDLRLKNVSFKKGLILDDLPKLSVLFLVNIQGSIALRHLTLKKLILKGCSSGFVFHTFSEEVCVDRFSSTLCFNDVTCKKLIKCISVPNTIHIDNELKYTKVRHGYHFYENIRVIKVKKGLYFLETKLDLFVEDIPGKPQSCLQNLQY